MTRSAPDLCFIHLDGVDAAGHAAGFGSTAYLEAVGRADEAVGVIRNALGATDHLLVTADHGGEGWDHILGFPSVMTVPWMVAGPDIRSGFAIEAPVSLLDTAPTLARLLGIRPPLSLGWAGADGDLQGRWVLKRRVTSATEADQAGVTMDMTV